MLIQRVARGPTCGVRRPVALLAVAFPAFFTLIAWVRLLALRSLLTLNVFCCEKEESCGLGPRLSDFKAQ